MAVHGLGRLHKPDSRDWQLETHLYATGDPLDTALAALTASRNTSKAVKTWATVVTPYLKAIPAPAPPSPPPAPGPSPSAVVWEDLAYLDQGQTPHCVGFGWAGWEACAPVEDKVGNADGDSIYYACKLIDGEPGAEDGSTVRSGAKVMRQRGRLTGYAFTQSIDTVTEWLLAKGPVVFGTDWTEAMFQPSPAGKVAPTGQVAGGHCYLGIGFDKDTGLIRCRNSWGRSWGLGGDFLVTVNDMATLLKGLEYPGEACAAVEVA